MPRPAVFFDFDNTLTVGDVLDDIVEKFSPNEDWREWERAWVEGRMAARDCLRLQVENLRVSQAALLEHLQTVRIDPAFAAILAWAGSRQVEVVIVSDSFLPLIRQILRNHAIDGVPVFANDLKFEADRLVPSFPFHDPALPRSANAKARHLEPYRGRTRIFAGDGHSDLDAALAADVVFAKDTLARELSELSVPFHPFVTLQTVLEYLESLDTGLDTAAH